jgi:hypothetical protein
MKFVTKILLALALAMTLIPAVATAKEDTKACGIRISQGGKNDDTDETEVAAEPKNKSKSSLADVNSTIKFDVTSDTAPVNGI